MGKVFSRELRRLVVAAFAATSVLCAEAAEGQGAGSAERVAVFNQPGVYKWTVPSGVFRVEFDLRGAQGGNSSANGILLAEGGLGGAVKATFSVRPGQVFEIVVGGQGGDSGAPGDGGGGKGLLGPGGGGATSVHTGCVPPKFPFLRCTVVDSILVAGGGGGAFGTDPGGAGSGFIGERGRAPCTPPDGYGHEDCRGNGGGGDPFTPGGGGYFYPDWLCFDPSYYGETLHIDYVSVHAGSGRFEFGGTGGFEFTNLAYRGNCDLTLRGSGGGGGWTGGGGSLSGTLSNNVRTVELRGTGGGGSGYVSPLALTSSRQSGVKRNNGTAVISVAR
jgi:hypothetical protein